MSHKVKKRVWTILPPSEGSRVLDARTGEPHDQFDIEEQVLGKISRYGFDRDVIFHGFQDPPEFLSKDMRIKVSGNCIDRNRVENVVYIGRNRMEWFLRRKEK